MDAQTFLKGIAEIPGEIVFVRLVDLDIDLSEAGALATGIQHARVRIGGKDVDDRDLRLLIAVERTDAKPNEELLTDRHSRQHVA
jgi:hypothetical protein